MFLLSDNLDYFVDIGLSHEEATMLHLRYYSQYGLALRGLKRHHAVGNATSVWSRTWAKINVFSRCTGFRPQVRWFVAPRRHDLL